MYIKKLIFELTHYIRPYLSILMAIFLGGPGLASNRMSPFWILLELRMMEMLVTTGAMRHAELQSNHQQTNIQFRTGRLSPNQQCHNAETKCFWLYVELYFGVIL